MKYNSFSSLGPGSFLLGLLSGIFLLLLIYMVIFQVTETDFTFSGLARLHSGSPSLYLLDILPLATGFITFMTGLKIKEMFDSHGKLILKEKEDRKVAMSFLESLKSGKFKERPDINTENELHQSLEDFRLRLQKSLEEEEIRKTEDQHRSWTSEGLAGFSEILRQPGENREDFAYVLISRLVKYLDANQGGFFVIENNNGSGKYLKMLACHAYDPKPELGLKSIFDFLDRRDLENFNDIWEQVIKGIPFQGQVRFMTRLDEEKWFRSTFTSVNDMYGEVSKIVFLANEITNERLMEMESRKQTEQLKNQEEKLRITGMEMERKMKEEAREEYPILSFSPV